MLSARTSPAPCPASGAPGSQCWPTRRISMFWTRTGQHAPGQYRQDPDPARPERVHPTARSDLPEDHDDHQ